jgi:hypothetical protein
MIDVEGNPVGREYLIEEAIGRIQADPAEALKAEYLGIKNYAHFGDQRCDCSYGYGPTHGTIVFSIGRVRGAPLEPDADIQELLRVRDFGGPEIPASVIDLLYRGRRGRQTWNYQQAKTTAARMAIALEEINRQLATVQEVQP